MNNTFDPIVYFILVLAQTEIDSQRLCMERYICPEMQVICKMSFRVAVAGVALCKLEYNSQPTRPRPNVYIRLAR